MHRCRLSARTMLISPKQFSLPFQSDIRISLRKRVAEEKNAEIEKLAIIKCFLKGKLKEIVNIVLNITYTEVNKVS